MQIQKREDGQFDLTNLTEEDVKNIFYGVQDYHGRLSIERSRGEILGHPVGDEDIAFLDEIIPRVKVTATELDSHFSEWRKIIPTL